MKVSKFIDFKGKKQVQYDSEKFDNREFFDLIKYPQNIVILIQIGMRFEQIPYNKSMLIHDSHMFRLLSLVNYDDLKYTSIVAERRPA